MNGFDQKEPVDEPHSSSTEFLELAINFLQRFKGAHFQSDPIRIRRLRLFVETDADEGTASGSNLHRVPDSHYRRARADLDAATLRSLAARKEAVKLLALLSVQGGHVAPISEHENVRSRKSTAQGAEGEVPVNSVINAAWKRQAL